MEAAGCWDLSKAGQDHIPSLFPEVFGRMGLSFLRVCRPVALEWLPVAAQPSGLPRAGRRRGQQKDEALE